MTERIGQQLGNYRLVRHLGKGGFAEVYLGEHIYLKTQAAIKILQTKVANQEDLDGFLKEAQTIARLVHPHIVRVLDFGVDGETPFLAMDYAETGTLRQLYPKGTPLPLTTIIAYVKQIAEALQYAHDDNVIHRDVKPENMLVGRRNEILLSDFGIALMAQSSRYQSTQEVIGTVVYMAPEQIQGKPRPASDQYSLGIVVYEWIRGDRPFHGSFTELCTQHLFASPPPLRENMPTILPAVEQVVMRALSKDPKQRFASIQTFATALEQASRVSQPDSSTQPQSLTVPSQPLPSPTMTAPAMPFSQQSVTSSPVEGVQTLSTLSDQSRQTVSSSRLQKRPELGRQGISRRAILLGLGMACLMIVSSGLTWLLATQIPHRLSSSDGISSSSPASVTASVRSIGLLYEAGSEKGWSGWKGTSEWYVNGDLLLSKGTDDHTTIPPTIIAPYLVNSTNNYALEATVRIVGGKDGCFFLATRGSFTANQWSGYKTATCMSSSNFDLQDSFGKVLTHANFTPGNGYHVYRIEVQGPSIHAYIDGGLIAQVDDTSVPSGNQVGIKTLQGQIEVSDFKVIGI